MERQVEQARWWVGSPATTVSTGESHPAAVAAAATREGRAFLHWSRFPYFRIQEIDGGYRVRIVDARYEADWASLVLDVPGALAAETRLRDPQPDATKVSALGIGLEAAPRGEDRR